MAPAEEHDIRPDQHVIDGLARAGHATQVRNKGLFIVCMQRPVDDEGQCGRSILLVYWHGEYVICEWGGIPAYAAAEKDVLPCFLDPFAAPTRPCLALGSDLCQKYGIKRHGAFEAELRELMLGGGA